MISARRRPPNRQTGAVGCAAGIDPIHESPHRAGELEFLRQIAGDLADPALDLGGVADAVLDDAAHQPGGTSWL